MNRKPGRILFAVVLTLGGLVLMHNQLVVSDEARQNQRAGRVHNEETIPRNTSGTFFGVLKRYVTERTTDVVPDTLLPVRDLTREQLLQLPDDRLFFSGDSGYFDGFKRIGEKYGPFDLTMIEAGAYDRDWPAVHMTPEQSVQAHLDLQGHAMMPIHNGTFNLAFHTWYEPLERVAQAADARQVRLSTPIPGEVLEVRHLTLGERWWRPLIPHSQSRESGQVEPST